MKKISPSFTFEENFDGLDLLKKIEKAARTCYKSEEKIESGTAPHFVSRIIKLGHESVLEHAIVTVRIVCDRGISHEIVRHRIASFSQESTRYCNYTSGKFGKEISVIEPRFFDKDTDSYNIWLNAMTYAEQAYFKLIELGASPQMARSVLPNSLKTEIVVTMNLREWRHFFRLRTSDKAHPQMIELAIPMLEEFRRKIPVVFDDI